MLIQFSIHDWHQSRMYFCNHIFVPILHKTGPAPRQPNIIQERSENHGHGSKLHSSYRRQQILT